MATPKGAITGALQTINLNSNAKGSPPNQAIGNADTLQFKNNDPANNATVTFQGAGAGVFTLNGSPITTLTVQAGGGVAGPLTPSQSNLTVNYVVSLGSNSGGPFSIEIGSGPLEIDVINANGGTNLAYAEIPNNGSLFFKNQTEYPGTVTFSNADTLFISPGNGVLSQPLPASSAAQTLIGKGTNKDVSYSVHLNTGEGHRVRDGGGSIKVGQT